jgi:hypothetical protein
MLPTFRENQLPPLATPEMEGEIGKFGGLMSVSVGILGCGGVEFVGTGVWKVPVFGRYRCLEGTGVW